MLPPPIPSERPAALAPAPTSTTETRPDACDGCGTPMPGGAEVIAFERGSVGRYCSFRCQEGGAALPCVPPPPPAWRPTGLVRDALIELRVRCDGDRAETAERLRVHYSRRWTFASEYEARAIPALADALAAGDDGAAEDAARWIAAPDDAMARALAALQAPTGGSK